MKAALFCFSQKWNDATTDSCDNSAGVSSLPSPARTTHPPRKSPSHGAFSLTGWHPEASGARLGEVRRNQCRPAANAEGRGTTLPSLSVRDRYESAKSKSTDHKFSIIDLTTPVSRFHAEPLHSRPPIVSGRITGRARAPNGAPNLRNCWQILGNIKTMERHKPCNRKIYGKNHCV
jgi:hypothetical protein